MFRARCGARLAKAILLPVISLSISPMFARADSRWSLSLGGGLTDPFDYRSHSSQPYGVGGYEAFGSSGLAVAGAAYRVSDHASLRADVGYLGYQRELRLNIAQSLAGIPQTWPSGSLGARMPSISAGVRLYASGPATTRPLVYIEATPALWVARWRERVETPGHYDLSGNYYPSRVDQDAFTTLDPGFAAGAGLVGPFVGRAKLDFGFRYLFSIGPGQHQLGRYSSGDFKGLRQLALVMSLHLPM